MKPVKNYLTIVHWSKHKFPVEMHVKKCIDLYNGIPIFLHDVCTRGEVLKDGDVLGLL